MTRGLVVLSLATLLTACEPSQTKDNAAVRQVMMSTWDRPNTRLNVGPVVTDGAAAIADWTQGQLGGRAYLTRDGHGWRVVLCGGDALRTPEGLASLGLPAATATRLAARLRRAEADVAPDRLTRMSNFRGLVRMDSPAHAPTTPPTQH